MTTYTTGGYTKTIPISLTLSSWFHLLWGSVIVSWVLFFSRLHRSCQRRSSHDIAFLALNWLHELHDLSLSWQNHTKNIPCSPNGLPWPDTAPPMSKEDFCYHYTDTDIEYYSGDGLEMSQDDGKDGEDEASQDDEEEGEVEPDEMEENGTLAAAMAMLDMTEDADLDPENLEGF